MGQAWGEKALFHFRGQQSVRRCGRCGRRRLCRRPDGEEDKRRELNAPAATWRRKLDLEYSQ